MGGHVDDAELDLSLPLVSLSLGLSAVFLFGGPTRDDTPTALWLRSGDAIVVTGEARLCSHGVPRIVEGSCPEYLLDPESLREVAAVVAAAGAGQSAADSNSNSRSGEQSTDSSSRGQSTAATSLVSPDVLAGFLSSARLNVNVRQLAQASDAEELARIIAERTAHDTQVMSSVLRKQSARPTVAVPTTAMMATA